MTDHAAVILEWLMDEWTSWERDTRTPENNPALAALAALERELQVNSKRIQDLEQELTEWKLAAAAEADGLDEFQKRAWAAEAELAEAKRERDDYRFWNERVRTCEHHTQDVAAPVGDCLICNVDAAELALDAATKALNDLLNEVDCRIGHGANSGGHLEYVRTYLRGAAALAATEDTA